MPITYTNSEVYAEASLILKQLYGVGASFRDGQYEAIEATMTKRRTLIVREPAGAKVWFTSYAQN